MKTSYTQNYNTFAGEIDIDDFSTETPNKKRINKYIEADNLEKTIIKKERQKKEMKNFQSMTLEELREMKLVSNTNGRPNSTLTDEKWQKEFEIRKIFVKPVSKDIKRFCQKSKCSKETGYWNEETMGTYHGATNWQEYCAYINDVLRNIQSGQIDYCYYIYQILDILKFHYDDLRTKYCDGYWEVWLDLGENK